MEPHSFQKINDETSVHVVQRRESIAYDKAIMVVTTSGIAAPPAPLLRQDKFVPRWVAVSSFISLRSPFPRDADY